MHSIEWFTSLQSMSFPPLVTEFGTYNFVRQIGQGTNAIVYLGVEQFSKMQVSLKVLNTDDKNYRDTTDIEREVGIMNTISHPFIADVYAVADYEGTKCLICEYVNGMTLLDYVNNNGPLDEMLAQKIFHQLLLVIEYLHKEKHVIHRDLKCENILLDGNKNIRLVDFEFAKKIENKDMLCETACGSLAYIAPEILREQKYCFEADIWSLGIILYAITVGSLPFNDDNVFKLISTIINEEPDYKPIHSFQLISMIRCLLIKNPKERIILEEIKDHPWISYKYHDSRSLDLRLFSVVPPIDMPLDRDVLMMLDIPESDENFIRYELLSDKPSTNTIRYKIVRKIKAITEMGTETLAQSLGRAQFPMIPRQRRRNSMSLKETADSSLSPSSPTFGYKKQQQSRILRPSVLPFSPIPSQRATVKTRLRRRSSNYLY